METYLKHIKRIIFVVAFMAIVIIRSSLVLLYHSLSLALILNSAICLSCMIMKWERIWVSLAVLWGEGDRDGEREIFPFQVFHCLSRGEAGEMYRTLLKLSLDNILPWDIFIFRYRFILKNATNLYFVNSLHCDFLS